MTVYEAGKGEYTTYSDGDIVTLDAIAPGFSSSVNAFFPA